MSIYQFQLDNAQFSFRRRDDSDCTSGEIRITGDQRTISAAGFDITFSSIIPSPLIFGPHDQLSLSGTGWEMVLTPEKVTLETDWLGLTNIFFDSCHKRGGSDHSVFTGLSDFDPVGLDLYLRYGYCCLGRTPFSGVRQLCSGESLILQGGALRLIAREDPLHRYLDRGTSSVTEVLDLIRNWFVNKHGHNHEGLIIPLTGGYDSRLLTALCRDVFPARDIISPTWGVSAVQHWSYEVTRARKVSNLLKTKHQFVSLSTANWNERIEQWINVRGFSSHAHGMHFIEFYETLRSLTDVRSNISGIYGDLWAGHHNPRQGSTQENDYEGYFLPHQMNYQKRLQLDESKSLVREKIARLAERDVDDPEHLTLLARNKIVLINYLFGVPNSQGFFTSSPFVDPEIVAAMLRLPAELKKDRMWLTDYFNDAGLRVRSTEGLIARSNVFFVRCCWNTSFEKVGDGLLSDQFSHESFGYESRFGKVSLMMLLATEYFTAITKLSSVTSRMDKYLKPVFRKMVRYYHLMPLKKQTSGSAK